MLTGGCLRLTSGWGWTFLPFLALQLEQHTPRTPAAHADEATSGLPPDTTQLTILVQRPSQRPLRRKPRDVGFKQDVVTILIAGKFQP